jgi:threonine dehydrogenase-like Zn-dependent dehydrogenase
VDRSRAVALDDDLDAALATLIPNAETAASLVLDGAPLLGERVGVLGLGIVGRITADLLADFPVAALDLADPSPYRRALAERVIPPRSPTSVADRLRDDYDLLFELSGNPAALAAAIRAAGYDGRVVIGSWYGSKPVSLDLGTDFHRKRLRMFGSQVSTIAPSLRGRWDAGRRLGLALSWCRRRSAEDWVSHRVPFSASRAAYELLMDSAAEYAHVVLSMEE